MLAPVNTLALCVLVVLNRVEKCAAFVLVSSTEIFVEKVVTVIRCKFILQAPELCVLDLRTQILGPWVCSG